jgi:tetratricopeptide (TPR) repeat protein
MRFFAVLHISLIGAGVIFVLLPAIATAKHLPPVDKLGLLELLKAAQFEELNARLSKYREEFESGQASDYRLNYALSAFATTDPEVTEPLENWVAAYPESELPLLARSKHNSHLAHISRGEYAISETPRERLNEMGRHLAMAAVDAARAIELNPGATVAYAILIDVAMYKSNSLDRKRLADSGLANSPTSDLIRYAYLSSLMPWWGGSLEEIRAFIVESKAALPAPVDGYSLDGQEHYVKGLLAMRNGRRNEANTHFNTALTFGERISYLMARARNNWELREGDRGGADFLRSLEIAPQSPGILDAVASFHAFNGEFEEAFRLWELALELDPLNPVILRARAFHRSRIGEYELAREDFEQSMVFGALDHANRFERGRFNLMALDDREAARTDLQIATRVAPKRAMYWYYYGEALTEGKNSEVPECRAVEVFEKFLELCQEDNDCNATQVATARYFTTQRPLLYGSC